MHNSKNDPKKLFPLRNFVIPGLYEMPYLSILAQRKKLKTKKVGRNYFTCELWFNEYLEKHAQTKKRRAYQKQQERKIQPAFAAEKSINKKYIKINIKTAVLMAVVFILFLLIGFSGYINFQDSKGKISGVEERHGAAGYTDN